jgi:tetratricopeptide (TPR) repeat protein
LVNRVDQALTKCYRALPKEAALVAEYNRLFGRHGLPGVVYLGEDRQTQGDWIGRYGGYAFILCGMSAPRDIVGGKVHLLKCDHQDPAHAYANVTVWGDGEGELRYTVWTGDPAGLYRHFTGAMRTEDRRALRNPLWGERTFALWDDRGETHPHDGKGPDLFIQLPFPPGLWQLALYFVDWDWKAEDLFHSAHRVEVTDTEGRPWAETEVTDFGGGVYKIFAVNGPLEVVVCVRKGPSGAAGISGVFWDRLEPPAAVDTLVERIGNAGLAQALQDYETWRAQYSREALTYAQRVSDLGRLADQLQAVTARRLNPNEAVAAWQMRWQVEAAQPARWDAAREAFQRYVAARVQRDGAGSICTWLAQAVDSWFAQGYLGWAQAAMDEWLDRRSHVVSVREQASDLEQVALRFRQRDLVYAEMKVARAVDLLLPSPDADAEPVAALARRLEQVAEVDCVQSRERWRLMWRLPETVYRRWRERKGKTALGEAEQLRLAQACERQTWYSWGWDKMLREYENFVALYPEAEHVDRALLGVVWGCIMSTEGEWDSRIAHAERAVMQMAQLWPPSPYVPSAQYLVALAYQRAGRWAEAERRYKALIVQFPASSGAGRARLRLAEVAQGNPSSNLWVRQDPSARDVGLVLGPEEDVEVVIR